MTRDEKRAVLDIATQLTEVAEMVCLLRSSGEHGPAGASGVLYAAAIRRRAQALLNLVKAAD